MGGLLSSKQKVQEWKAIEESNIGDNDGGKYEIMPILKLSYKHLPSEMKQCFAFCAVSLKDYEMEKDRLIQLWMANGFIQEEGTMDLTQKGELIFDELVWRSFLQDNKVVVKSAVIVLFGDNTKYETIVCKMHDLMHDLAKDVSDECASIEELTHQKALFKGVCHMQMSKAELEQTSLLCKGRTYLRTMLVPSKSWMDEYILSKSHKYFKELLQVSTSLRALHCSSSPIVICMAINAKHLRYLDLSGSNIVRLPNSVCMLYNLQTLRLIDCKELQQLPEDMARFRKLIHLYLSGCVRLGSMSPNFGLMNNLHILTTFVVDTGDSLGIEQLKDLQHLRNRLELLNLSKIKSGEDSKEVNLSQKHNLSEFLFSWDKGMHDVPTDVEEVLQSLEPHRKIQKLEMRGYGGLEISQWMRKPQMFNCLRELKISDCPRCKSIPVVWLSESLEILSLTNMVNLTTLFSSVFRRIHLGSWFTEFLFWSHDTKFMMLPLEAQERLGQRPIEKLKNLYLEGANSLVTSSGWSRTQLMVWKCFLFVEDLTIRRCNDLVHWPAEELRCLDRLRILHIENCDNLEGNTTSSEEETLPLSLEEFVIEYCPRMVSLPLNLGNLAKLRSLRVDGCRRLKELPNGMCDLTSLRELKIWHCPAMEEFPHGLLERLLTLEYLSIDYCPELERRCREGGLNLGKPPRHEGGNDVMSTETRRCTPWAPCSPNPATSPASALCPLR
uniref:Putative disease resistance protein RGA1 n=1 Tax=Aegilops tauschii TaxID=37682 RepID=N1QY47_AEGTA